MKPEDAVKMIELCLESCDMAALIHLTDYIIEKRVGLSIPKKRGYKSKRDIASTGAYL